MVPYFYLYAGNRIGSHTRTPRVPATIFDVAASGFSTQRLRADRLTNLTRLNTISTKTDVVETTLVND